MQPINCEQQTEQITNFIRQVLKKSGFVKSVVAISGGVDSAASLMLLSKAIGPTNTLAAMMPYGDQDIGDAKRIINMTKIPSKNIFLINIEEIVRAIVKKLKQLNNETIEPRKDFSNSHSVYSAVFESGNQRGKQFNNEAMEQLRLGNIMARVRMIILYDLAKANKALVCGTENKSERLLGYFTLHGDSASDFEPLTHLYKTQLKQLAKFLGIPQSIIDKAPTAGLWPGQTDEQELGFSYAEADEILALAVDKKMPVAEIVKKGFSLEIVNKVLQKVSKNSFKHKVPYCL
jgi:NAD+ synthase